MANGKLQPFISSNQSKHHCYTLSTTCTLFKLASEVGPRTSSRKLLSGNSVMKVISWKNKPIFTEIILLLIRQNTIPYGQRHYQCL